MNLPRILPALAVLLVTVSARAQTPAPGSTDSEALRLLRQTIAAQARHPDLVIRNFTNDVPVLSNAPARVQTPRDAAAAELERRYLGGRLSLRDYEKGLARLQIQSPGPTNAPAPAAPVKAAPAAAISTSPKASSGPRPALEPAIATTPPQPTERQKKISDVETKLDEMLRLKEARERAAQTNAPPPDPGKKLTKRERLDFLLRQVVQGKLSDEEYKKERERILAEPD